jgi:hypothetical protein
MFGAVAVFFDLIPQCFMKTNATTTYEIFWVIKLTPFPYQVSPRLYFLFLLQGPFRSR